MGRSQLLKDLVNGTTSIENILLRLKVILSDLDNEQIMNWVDGELRGYPGAKVLPEYRILHGMPYGTFIVNYRFQNTNSLVPIDSLIPSTEVDELLTVPCTDSIKTIEEILNENDFKYGRPIPTSYCHGISTGALQIASMTILVAQNHLSEIVSIVKSKLVDVIMELEDQYEHLDDLDIKSQVEDDEHKKTQVTNNIGQIIFGDSIKLGDNNKVKGSAIGKFLEGVKKWT